MLGREVAVQSSVGGERLRGVLEVEERRWRGRAAEIWRSGRAASGGPAVEEQRSHGDLVERVRDGAG